MGLGAHASLSRYHLKAVLHKPLEHARTLFATQDSPVPLVEDRSVGECMSLQPMQATCDFLENAECRENSHAMPLLWCRVMPWKS
ncbi:hypothetical protein CERZMDRAFT_90635 [Cercospora zeae-maydis SCOH1-5]|uniref:Uncharacterized protein n=1 Tax=Cercospora zeae-maydis SCOH1-5 TaxID=717836 RepID=A0A6A6FGT2_9PEZI|nr:hypothetical protein CERZMDRAFT_90635 [Cercospora zeae-maydis SCOH1-5]